MDETNNSADESLDVVEGNEANDSTGPDEALNRFFGTAKEVIQKYSHCVLCGAHLHFTHQTDFSRNLTQEMAKCPECGIKVKSVIHRLQ